MERNGVAIADARAATGISTGIAFGAVLDGWVPDYEIYSAMIHAHHTEVSWAELSWAARARAVAHLRLSRLIALHESDAAAVKPKK